MGATVVDAPMGGLAIRRLAAEMAEAAGDRLLTPAGGGGCGGQWRLVAGAEWRWRGMEVCAAGRSAFGAVAVVCAMPQPEVPLGLMVAVGYEAGGLMRRRPAGGDSQRRRDAGIKSTDGRGAGVKPTDGRGAGKWVSFIWSAAARHTQHGLIRHAWTPQIRSGWGGGLAYGLAADAGREVFGNGE